MHNELDDQRLKPTHREIVFLAGLLAITGLLHVCFYMLSKSSDIDLGRFITRSSAALEGKISYKDEELISDPKPLWTYFLALWLFFCHLIARYLFNLRSPSTYDEEYTKILLVIANLIMVIVIFYASKDLFSPKAAYFASSFYAINLFPLLIGSVVGKYDVLPALCILIAVWMVSRSQFPVSAAALGIGTMFKYLAGLPLPIILIALWKREQDTKKVLQYLVVYGLTCLFIASPFLIINTERFIDSTVFFFIRRKGQGPKSYFHPYYYIPHHFLIIFPLFVVGLICYYTLRKESISDYDLIMLLFMEISVFVFTNKAFLPQYFFYAIPYLALAFPNMLLREDKVHYSTENVFPAIAAIMLPNLLAGSFLEYFIDITISSFDNFELSKLLDFQGRYEFAGVIDGRIFIASLILIVYLSLKYLLKNQKMQNSIILHK